MTEQDKELHMLNLVSRGMPLKEARQRVYGVVETPPEAPAAPSAEDTDLETLRKKLTDAGIPFHPKAGLAKLRNLAETINLL